jgi:hypothetical protein
MQFMMMMKCPKGKEAGNPPDPRVIEAIEKHSAEARKAGILLSTGGLLSSAKGALIQVANGKANVIDGPFAETKELIGGFAILKADSKEDAVRMGREFMQLQIDILGPSYEGEMEIRQMWDEGARSSAEAEELADATAGR